MVKARRPASIDALRLRGLDACALDDAACWDERARSTTMRSLEARLAVALRARVGLLVLAVLSISYAIAAGCIVMLTAAILLLRKGPSAPPKDETAPAPSRASVVLMRSTMCTLSRSPLPCGLRRRLRQARSTANRLRSASAQ